MTIGLTIPGVPTVHPRESWVETCYPVLGSPQVMSRVTQPACHYSAAAMTPDGDLGESIAQVPSWLRAVNRDYWLNRTTSSGPRVICGRSLPGYAIGYLFAVDWLGGAWELRGFDYVAASNAPTNAWTFPILFITDGASPATEWAWWTARAVWREAARRSGNPGFVRTAVEHSRLPGAATECSGVGIRAQLAAGYGNIDRNTEESDMGVSAVPEPKRIFDSRGLAGVDDPYDDVNTELGLIVPGAPRRIFVALGAEEALLNVTAIGTGQPGFLTVTPTSALTKTSDVNYGKGPDDPRPNNVLTRLTEGGYCWIHAVVSPANVAVDLRGL